MFEPRMVMNPALAVVAAVVGTLLLVNVASNGFARLGLPGWAVGLVLVLSIAGSVINIPIYMRDLPSRNTPMYAMNTFVFQRHPQIEHQVLAINVGGAIVPIALSAWLLTQAPLLEIAGATAVVALVSHHLAEVVPGEGIRMPALIPPLVAVGIAWLLAGARSGDAVAIAYVAGSMGTLIGADLWNIGRVRRVGPGVVSIGGAGVVDGVFVAGMLAAVLA
jgi:uncharacterized membrane protein